ncbi:MAG: NADH-quinone oxidoreductase subunit D [Desulfurellaceae bacterium]|nr:NADH-quinone oxidoreductase subunit D [Desulfurellaceae bacterium]
MSLAGYEVEVQRGEGLATEEMTLNMGPQHPSTHGVLRFVVKADGEVMRTAIPDIGYLHRSIEKISEKVGYHGFMPYTDRVDYVSAMQCNQGWGMACERLAGIEVPRRGEFCRVIACELGRMASHLLSVGTMVMDIGGYTPFLHAIREREKINNLLEELCGARLTFNYMRVGGVAWDLPPNYADTVLAFLDQFEPLVDEYNDLISYNKIYVERLANVAVVSQHEAINYNLVGPNLRACGIKYDVRRDEPYSIYPELDFDIPTGTGEMGQQGDCFDRYMTRIRELKECCKIVRQCLAMIPDGPVLARVPRKLKPPAGDVYVRVEGSRGDMGWYVVSDGTEFPYRTKIRTGSFSAMSIVDKVSQGLMIADLIALIASFDVVAPEVDR